MSDNIKDDSVNNDKDSTHDNLNENTEQDNETEQNHLAEEEQNEGSNENNGKENLDSIKKELEVNKDKLLRSLAENENIRKQIEKIRLETNKYGVQPLAREMLNVVDNFNRALSLKTNNSEKVLEEGFSLIQKEILNILEKFNVKKIEALGEDFDANYHQAMFEKETDDFEERKVCEIVQDGYTFHDRLLRPVLVGVAKKLDKKGDDKQGSTNEKEAKTNEINNNEE
ncbi:MAG: nucleotide exchange factor GrpE [Alphaproteobacteria bacterium TMED62]|nr:MAG: nucleotide exchange factor GrpE [Alphaproteobacteria bacterium TMED62]|tara:strand:+ start:294 stop:974 length:681 start_codon:yes stop_codon:yes gene_type:complete